MASPTQHRNRDDEDPEAKDRPARQAIMRHSTKLGPGRAGAWWGSAILAVAAWACSDAEVSAPEPPPPLVLEELVPGFAYADWFEQHTGIAPDPAGFGAYRVQSAGSEVFIGLGATFPNRGDGALIASFDGTEIEAIAALDEQGFADMTTAGDLLLVPGVDPCCGDDWSLGNLYLYSATTGFIKRRTIPNVVHGFGVWYDPNGDAVYVSAGSHLGNEVIFTGAIWRSLDWGLSWNLVADRSNGVGEARTYDVFGFEGTLYAVRADGFDDPECELVVQRTGDIWDLVTADDQTACWPRIISALGQVLVPDASREALHAVSSGSPVTLHDLPFRLPLWGIHWGVVVDGVLYALTDEGNVVRSLDLQTWETVITSDHALITIEYWAERDWLVVGSIGASTGLWRIDLDPPPLP